MAGTVPTDTNSAQYQILGSAAQGLNFIPVAGPALAAVATTIVSLFAKAHLEKVKVEAQTLSAAVPQWRSLLLGTIDAFNAGQIDASSAVSYVEEAKGIYYEQVKNIERGTPHPPGIGPDPAYSGPHGRFAPIDPCNGACSVGYFFVEPEAAMVESAFRSNQTVTIDLLEIAVLNTGGQGGAPATRVTISPPILSSILPADIANSIPPIVKNNPLIFGVAAILAVVVLWKW